jgi:hypothetical protein
VALQPDHGSLFSPAAMGRLLQLAPLARLVALPTLLVAVGVAAALTTRAPATRAALAGSPVEVVEAAARRAAPAVRVGLGLTERLLSSRTSDELD